MLEDYTSEELYEAFAAIHDTVIADKLMETKSELVVFLFDMKLQEELFRYFDNLSKH